MAIKFEKIEPGMVLLDIHREKMGNTTMSELGCWKVKVFSVDKENQTAVVSWNDNAKQTYHRRQLERLYVNLPKAYRRQEEAKRDNGVRYYDRDIDEPVKLKGHKASLVVIDEVKDFTKP